MNRLYDCLIVAVELRAGAGSEVRAQSEAPSDLSVQSVAVTAVELDRVGPSTAICWRSCRSTE